MAAQYPGTMPSFSGMVGTSTDPLSAPSHVTLEQKQADEIVALATFSGLRPQYGSGLWYSPSEHAAVNSQVNTVGDVRLFREDFPPNTTITGLAINLVTVGAAGATKTLLIYNDNGTSSYPTTLQKATSALDCAAGTGTKSETFAAEAVGGVRWIGTLTLVNTSTVTGMSNGRRGVGATSISVGNNIWTGYIQTGQGSAPGTFTSTRTPVNGMDRVLFQIG
jgi:hypothetical protein